MADILVVDDDPDVLKILCTILVLAGHNVIQAPDGTTALDILDAKQPLDLLLTDVIMPGLNGFNLARMARDRRPFLKILYLTAFNETVLTMRDKGDKLGNLLTKPITPDELEREIYDTLNEDSLAEAFYLQKAE